MRLAARLRRILPWLVAAGMLAYLFKLVPAEKLQDALERAPLAWFLVLNVAYVVACLTADAFAIWVTIRYTLPGTNLSLRTVTALRGTTYLLSILHYGVGQGGIVYFLNRRHQVPVPRAVGSMVLTAGVNVVVVAACAFLGVTLGGAPDQPVLRTMVIVLGCTFPAYLSVIAARPKFLARRQLLAPLFEAGIKGHMWVLVARVPHFVVLLLGHILAMRLFGVTPPLGKALAVLPLLFVMGVLPISPAGVGTSQVAAVALLSPYGPSPDPEAAVLAYSLALQFVSLIVQALLGLLFLAFSGGERPPEPSPD